MNVGPHTHLVPRNEPLRPEILAHDLPWMGPSKLFPHKLPQHYTGCLLGCIKNDVENVARNKWVKIISNVALYSKGVTRFTIFPEYLGKVAFGCC